MIFLYIFLGILAYALSILMMMIVLLMFSDCSLINIKNCESFNKTIKILSVIPVINSITAILGLVFALGLGILYAVLALYELIDDVC